MFSEHVAFVRAGGIEAGHLLPVQRTRESPEIVVENVLTARQTLPAPLALENIAALVEWPEGEMGEAEFLAGLRLRPDSVLLLDVSDVHANARVGVPGHPAAPPAEYVHVGGGVERGQHALQHLRQTNAALRSSAVAAAATLAWPWPSGCGPRGADRQPTRQPADGPEAKHRNRVRRQRGLRLLWKQRFLVLRRGLRGGCGG